MWYSNGKNAEDWLEDHSGDEAVVRAVAEHLIRRKALLINRRDLDPTEVQDLVNGVVEDMTSKYGNLSDVRRHTTGDSLVPIVSQYIPESL